MPFGLTNAPATFQRAMETALRDTNYRNSIVFIDDILIYSTNQENHLKDLREVLQHLKKAGVSLNRDKCAFGLREVEYLGFVIRNGQLFPCEDKVEPMLALPTPQNRKELMSVLGTVQYYRRFIPNFANMAVPLFRLLKKNQVWNWSEREETAFKNIKESLAGRVRLTLPDFNKPFILTTDASQEGLAAILTQKNEQNIEIPVTFLSRTTTKAEKNYSTTDLECLAVVWAVKKLSNYLKGMKFTIITDHQALLSILSKGEDQTGRRGRWVTSLYGFTFNINHRKGKLNPADALSRFPKIKRVDLPLTVRQILLMTEEEFAKEPRRRSERRKRRNYRLQNEKICTSATHPVGEGKEYLENLNETKEILYKIHLEGHLGVNNIVDIFKRKYYAEDLKNISQRIVNHCEDCIRYTRDVRNNTLTTMEAEYVGQKLGIDIVGPLTETKAGNRFIITAIDYFTRWVFAKATRTIEALDVENFLCSEVLPVIGVPSQIISDRGRQFVSEHLITFYEKMGIRGTPSTAYHPQTNGLVERWNGTLQRMLKRLNSLSNSWDEHIWQCLMTYRSIKNETTGKSPAEMLYGRSLTTPAIFQIPDQDEEIPVGFTGDVAFRSIQQTLKQIHKEAKIRGDRKRALYSANYNKGIRPFKFNVGQKVLKRIQDSSKWEHELDGPYTICRILRKGAYIIRDVDGNEDSVSGDEMLLF